MTTRRTSALTASVNVPPADEEATSSAAAVVAAFAIFRFFSIFISCWAAILTVIETVRETKAGQSASRSSRIDRAAGDVSQCTSVMGASSPSPPVTVSTGTLYRSTTLSDCASTMLRSASAATSGAVSFSMWATSASRAAIQEVKTVTM